MLEVLLTLVSFERLTRGFRSVLRSALYHPPGSSLWASPSPQSEGQKPKQPPSSGKMTTTDNEDYPIWHRADSKDILSSCGQLFAEHSCATSKSGSRREGRRLEMGSVMERCGYRVWQAKRRGKKAPGPSHKTQQAMAAACQWGPAVNNVTHDIILGATQEVDMHHVTWNHRRFPTILCSSSFSDWFLQSADANWKLLTGHQSHPDCNVLSGSPRASRHIVQSICLQTLRHICAKGIWDTLRTFNFHLALSRRAGCLSQESFVSGAMEQLWALILLNRKNSFKLLYVVYFRIRVKSHEVKIYF